MTESLNAATAPGSWTVPGSAALVRWNGRWLLDVARGGARGATLKDPALWRLLGELARRPAADHAALERLALDAGVPAGAVSACLASLERAGLLRPAADPGREPPDGSPALYDWFLAGLAAPADYRDPTLTDDDLALMASYAHDDPPPPAVPAFPAGARRVQLPHPVTDPAGHPLRVLGGVLYLSHAVVEDAAIGPLPRSRRVPPSHGASHPFDLCVGCRWADGATTVHAYDPGLHALVPLADTDRPEASGAVRRLMGHSAVGPGDALITVHLAARRVQWRYRTGAAYPTVFLDLGHLLEALSGAAEWHGSAAVDVPVARTAPLGPGDAQGPGPVLAARALRGAAAEGS
ncbi:hypothetical protein ABZ508_21595 [Streptomyces lavendulocolor]|uniref:Uncharacterized protein n=1 Tax=Streptomyces lavendulocolor TaxID=67316 RepID=A0ABV2W9W5_9ACTN